MVAPSGVFVVAGASLEAAVEDADEPVDELAKRGVVAHAAVAERLVLGDRSQGPLLRGIGEPSVAGVAGQDDLPGS